MARKRTLSTTAGKVSNTFVVEIERLVNESEKTQTDIADQIGYTNQNMITMFKRGVTRVPEDKVVPLAIALGGHGGDDENDPSQQGGAILGKGTTHGV